MLQDYDSRLQTSLVQFLFHGTCKTKLAILAFLYCRDFVKNPTNCTKILFSSCFSITHIYVVAVSSLAWNHQDPGARFIHTVCMHRIQWSCEGLTSVHNEYTGYTLKHLLLRHMYNLPLPNLCANYCRMCTWCNMFKLPPRATLMQSIFSSTKLPHPEV